MLLSPGGPRDATTPRAVEEQDFDQAAANIRPSWAQLPDASRSGAKPSQARTSHDPWGAALPTSSPAAPSWPAPPSHGAFDDDNPFAPRRGGPRSKTWLVLLGLGCVGISLAWLGDDEALPATPASTTGSTETKPRSEPRPVPPQALPSTGQRPASSPTPAAEAAAADEQTGAKVDANPAATKPAAIGKPNLGNKLGAVGKPGANGKAGASSNLGTVAKPSSAMAKPNAASKPAAIAKPAASTKLGSGAKPGAAGKPAAKTPASAKPQPRQVMRDLPVEPTPAATQRSLSNQFAPRRPASEAIRSNPYE